MAVLVVSASVCRGSSVGRTVFAALDRLGVELMFHVKHVADASISGHRVQRPELVGGRGWTAGALAYCAGVVG